MAYILKKHLVRKADFFEIGDKSIPAELFSVKNDAVDVGILPDILPCKKSSLKISARSRDGLWLGGSGGAVLLKDDGESLFFTEGKDLYDQNVRAILPVDSVVWILCGGGVSKITLEYMTCEEKAELLRNETLNIIDRKGMVSEKRLAVDGDLTSGIKFSDSDNDGGFTAAYCIGEMFHYAVLRKKLGNDSPHVREVHESAVRALRACVLLMYIHGRDDGFVARTYVTADAPERTSGLWLRRQGDTATAVPTGRETDGKSHKIKAPVPDCLASMYRDCGYTDDDIIYKADTSSDEITLHVINIYWASRLLDGEEDRKLVDLGRAWLKKFAHHIIRNNFELVDFTGEPTTWARWSERYFVSDDGWADACLNSAEALFYLKAALAVCGRDETIEKAYNSLLEKGYAKITREHYWRMEQRACVNRWEIFEDIMYGDHMLCAMSYWGLWLCGALSDELKDGFRSWYYTSMCREHHPIYDFPFSMCVPEDKNDLSGAIRWLYDYPITALNSFSPIETRSDVVKKYRQSGQETEMSHLLPMNERYVKKYDTNPYRAYNFPVSRGKMVDSPAQYTTSYWMGRYFGIIEEEC